VLPHWICCLMLSRLNPEHIFACANLLNIITSLLSQRIDVFSSFLCESHQTNAHFTTVSFSALWHIRKALYSGWGCCDPKKEVTFLYLKYVHSTMGVSKEYVSKFLKGIDFT